MSGITLAQAQAQLDALLVAQAGSTLMVRVGDRTVQYQSSSDLLKAITYWNNCVVALQRRAAGQHRVGRSLANFNGGSR